MKVEMGEIEMIDAKAYRSTNFISLHLDGLPDIPVYFADDVITSGGDPAKFEVRTAAGGSGGADRHNARWRSSFFQF